MASLATNEAPATVPLSASTVSPVCAAAVRTHAPFTQSCPLEQGVAESQAGKQTPETAVPSVHALASSLPDGVAQRAGPGAPLHSPPKPHPTLQTLHPQEPYPQGSFVQALSQLVSLPVRVTVDWLQ